MVNKIMAVIWQEVNEALCKAGVRSGEKHKDKEDEGEQNRRHFGECEYDPDM